MSSLGPEAKAIVEQAIGGDEPTRDDQSRVWRKLALSLTAAAGGGGVAAGVGTAAASSSAPPAATGAAAGGSGAAAGAGAAAGTKAVVVSKLAVATKIGAVIVGVTATSMIDPAVPRQQVLPEIQTAAPSSRAARGEAEATSHQLGAPSAYDPTLLDKRPPRLTQPLDDSDDELSGSGSPSAQRPRASKALPARHQDLRRKPPRVARSVLRHEDKGSRSKPTGSHSAAPPREGRVYEALQGTTPGEASTPRQLGSDALMQELRLLHRAQRALDARHPQIALQALEAHRLDFPHGQLARERRVVRALALCAVGQREAARRVAEKLLQAELKDSPLAQRLRNVCNEE